MPIDNSKLVAAPMPVKVGDKEFLMSPMDDYMHEEVNQWVRKRHIRLSAEATAGLSPELRDATISVATRDAHRIEWNFEEGLRIIHTAEGMAYFLYVCVKKNNPRIALGTIAAAVQTGDVQENTNEIIRTYKALNTVEVKNSEPPAE